MSDKKRKYVKPIARDVGVMAPVHGEDCITGTEPDMSPSCSSGTNTSGSCHNHGVYAENGCQGDGASPAWGCFDGATPGVVCFAGNDAG